jgi:hypothetical protein
MRKWIHETGPTMRNLEKIAKTAKVIESGRTKISIEPRLLMRPVAATA